MVDDKAIVVFSGGQNSTTCLFWAKENFTSVEAVTFDYEQKHALKKIKRVFGDFLINYIQEETLTCYNGIMSRGCGTCAACVLRHKGLQQYQQEKGYI